MSREKIPEYSMEPTGSSNFIEIITEDALHYEMKPEEHVNNIHEATSLRNTFIAEKLHQNTLIPESIEFNKTGANVLNANTLTSFTLLIDPYVEGTTYLVAVNRRDEVQVHMRKEENNKIISNLWFNLSKSGEAQVYGTGFRRPIDPDGKIQVPSGPVSLNGRPMHPQTLHRFNRVLPNLFEVNRQRRSEENTDLISRFISSNLPPTEMHPDLSQDQQ